MATTNDAWIGKRVAHRRAIAGMSQQQLGDILGVTRNYISLIENGHKPITARSMLYDIADALGVPNGDLTGQPLAVRTHEDLLTLSTVAAIRAALDYPQDAPATPRPLDELARVADTLMAARMDCDYGLLGAGLARLIAESRAKFEDTLSQSAGRVLVRGLVTASLTLKPIGWVDLALRCADLARSVATSVGDPDAYGAAEFATAQCVLTAGSRRRSYLIAATAANNLTISRGNTVHARAWQGLLHLHAAFSAASLGLTDDSDEHHQQAEALAANVTGNPWAMEFTTANCLVWRVGSALENGQPERAPQLALRVDRSQLRSKQRISRVDIDEGRGHYLSGDSTAAVRSFRRAYEIAPHELRTRPSVIEIVGQMVRDATPRPDAELRQLAALVGVDQ
jgi:transcriptional regulator with XRE-family HTH domain